MVLVFGIRVLGFGFWVLRFGVQVPGIEFRVSGFGFRELGVWCRGSGFGVRNVGVLVPFRASGFGVWGMERRVQGSTVNVSSQTAMSEFLIVWEVCLLCSGFRVQGLGFRALCLWVQGSDYCRGLGHGEGIAPT